jgi:hypothetical protein
MTTNGEPFRNRVAVDVLSWSSNHGVGDWLKVRYKKGRLIKHAAFSPYQDIEAGAC